MARDENGSSAARAPGNDESPRENQTQPEAARPPGAGPETEEQVPARFHRGLGLLLFLLVLGTATLGFAAWVANDRLEALDQRLASTEAGLVRAASEAALGEVQARVDRLYDIARALEERLDGADAARDQLEQAVEEAAAGLRLEIRDAVEQSLETVARPVLVPVDIERLLLIANDAARLGRDPNVALRALRTADRRLAALGDPIYGETRRLLAREVVALERVRRPDVEGMALTLDALQAQVSELPLRPAGDEAPATVEAADESNTSAERPWWRRLIGGIGLKLRELVVLRRTDSLPQPAPPPAVEALTTQNLHLRLEAARIALLGRDASAFRTQLDSVLTWVRRWHDPEQPAVAAMLDHLEALRSAELVPDLPDLSASLAALRKAMAARGTDPAYGDSGAAEEVHSSPPATGAEAP